MRGRVVSTKLPKTATVLIESKKTHPLYGKSYVYSKKYLADDPLGVKLGDIVELQKMKPVSKNKHWRIIKVIGRSMEEIVEQKLKEEAQEAISEVLPEEKEESHESEVDKQRTKKGKK